jgi:hypothetical protein
MASFDLKNATIKIKDNGSEFIEVNISEGNLTYTERRNIEYRRNRGLLDDVRLGDEEPVDVSIDALWEFLRADTGEDPSIEDALKQRGEASAWVSTDSDTCRPYAVDIEIYLAHPCGATKAEVILLSDFRYEEIQHDAREGQLSITGKCNVTEATVTRVTTTTPAP